MCLSWYFKRRNDTRCVKVLRRHIDNISATFINCSTSDYSMWEGIPDLDVHNNRHPSLTVNKGNNETIDISNISFINDLWLLKEPSEIIIKTSAFLPVVLWGLLGNILLLYILITNRHLRSPTNLLIGNMAAADLASILIHPWIFLVYDFFQNYQLGAFGCKTEGTIECSLLLAGVISLSAISYDRLTAIALPQETRLTRRGAKIVMVITWIAGFMLASPLFFYRTYKERQWLDFLEKYCTENTIVINIYWHVIITMMVWLPLIIMLGCYIAIFLKLRRYEEIVQKRKNLIQVNYKKKVARTMFIVAVTFMICRLPFTALIFYRNELLKKQYISENDQVQNRVNGVYQTLWFVSKYLIFLNAAVNPVIYGLTNERFRRAFLETPLSKWFNIYSENGRKRRRYVPQIKPKQKDTKETVLQSNKSKIFVIFKGKGADS